MAGLTPRYTRKNVIRGQAQVWYMAYDPVATLPSNELALGGDWRLGTNEIQVVTEGGSGLTSFTLTYAGQTTGSIAAAATAATVQTALVALSNIAPGDVVVTGSAGGPYTVTFQGLLAGTNVAAMTATPTGGTGTVVVTTSSEGALNAQALWTPIGATEGGVTMRFTRETNDISVEEQPNPLDVATNTLDPRVECTLAEDTLETMKLAYGGGTITEYAATTNASGYRDYKISNELEHLVLGMEGLNSFGFWRRVLFQDVLSVAQVETAFRRSESQRLYAVSFRLVSPVEDLIIREKTAAPTG